MNQVDNEYIVDRIIDALIGVYGEKKWKSFSAQQQHDMIMTVVRDAWNAMEETGCG